MCSRTDLRVIRAGKWCSGRRYQKRPNQIQLQHTHASPSVRHM